jgi:hypothetical protein
VDKLEFLDGAEAPNGEAVSETPVVEAPVAETPAVEEQPAEQETAEQKATRERDERGRFKAKEAEEPVMVPLKALHETRDELKALKAQLEAIQQPQQPQQSKVPDIFEDPEGFVAHQNAQLHAATLNTTLNISEEMTRAAVGQEAVNEAQAWGAQAFAQNPGLYQQFVSQRNPYGFLVEQYRKATAVAKLGDDPAEIEAFLAWKQSQQGAPPPAQATPQQPTPPPSIAAAPSAGGMQHIASGPGAAFDNFIK